MEKSHAQLKAIKAQANKVGKVKKIYPWQGDTETKRDRRISSDERSGVIHKMRD